MWKVVIIRMTGVTIVDDTENNARFAYYATMDSTLTLFAFLYNEKAELVETYFPTRKGAP